MKVQNLTLKQEILRKVCCVECKDIMITSVVNIDVVIIHLCKVENVLFMDELWDYLSRECPPIESLHKIIMMEEYDTDALNQDVETEASNLSAMVEDANQYQTIADYIYHQKCMSIPCFFSKLYSKNSCHP